MRLGKRWHCNWKLQEDGGNLIQPWWISNWGEGKINYPKKTQTGKREPTYGVAFAIQISSLTTSQPSPPISGWTAICQDMYTGEFYKKRETGFVDRSRTHFFSLFSLLFALFRWSSLSRFSAFLQHALSRGDRHLSKQAKSLYLSPRLQGPWSSQVNAYEKRHIPYLNASPTLEIVRYSRALLASDNGIKQLTSGNIKVQAFI